MSNQYDFTVRLECDRVKLDCESDFEDNEEEDYEDEY